jgi:hypothetical protein
MSNSNVKNRIADAAAAYIERIGMLVTRRIGDDAFVCLDGNQMVVVVCFIKQNKNIYTTDTIQREINKLTESIELDDDTRVDVIEFNLISEDRALLRHNRDYLSKDKESD